jgi:outer membrane protein assembly factor BamB
MSVLDTTDIDFSQHGPTDKNEFRREIVVRNEDQQAVLHVGLRSPATWLDIYPTEFALAPATTQTVVAELAPLKARNATLAPISVSVFGQYLALHASAAARLPADIETVIRITPPKPNCPGCGADLPDGARECRRCGERIRLCPVCGAPNNWLVRTCRVSPAHILRTETDWLATPGGEAAHALALPVTLTTHLARRWSVPAFAVSQPSEALEWSAPLAAFGMVIASAIDSAAGRATVQAVELATGIPLWEIDLHDSKGIYPDRGGMALAANDGLLYAATLGGHVAAIDSIRGTVRWNMALGEPVYGGVTLSGDRVIVPAGNGLAVLDRMTGEVHRTITTGGRLDTAPAVADGVAYIAGDDAVVSAFRLDDGQLLWRAEADGPFDAAPILRGTRLIVASMAGSVIAFDITAGAQLWKTKASRKPIAVSPALSADGLLFVAADDGHVHVIAAETGNLIRSRRVAAVPLRSAPVVSGETVFIGADDGNIYALDPDYNLNRVYETSPGARIATAGLALYGDTLLCAATNGVLYALQAVDAANAVRTP